MPSYRKASIRELASAAYELDSGIVEGRLRRSVTEGRLMVGSVELNEWLAKYDGQEIILIVASLDDDRPVSSKVCRTCGTEYVGIYCPRCREARIRLRGR
jgi:hypothetical protein